MRVEHTAVNFCSLRDGLTQTGAAAMQPQHEWVRDLIRQARAAGCRVYIKPNCHVPAAECPKELPLIRVCEGLNTLTQASLW